MSAWRRARAFARAVRAWAQDARALRDPTGRALADLARRRQAELDARAIVH